MPGNDGQKKARPQDKWDAKAGVISKTYKIDKATAIRFQEACQMSGVAMGTQLTKMMKQFIDETEKASE